VFNKCVDCDKKISINAKRCKKHANIKKSFKHGNSTKNHKCPDCGKNILGYSKRCFSCSLKYRAGSLNGNWKKGVYNNNFCKCGKHITYGRKRCWSCWKKELSKLYEGKKNPAYINGKAHEPYSSAWTNRLREFIRERDNHKCIICNNTGKCVHHIDYNKKNCKEDNLITLCRHHHSKTNHNRDYYFAYFIYIMENR